VADFDALPAAAKKDAQRQGAGKGDVEGVFHKGKIYLVKDMIRDEAHAETVLFHEALHKGLRELFADHSVNAAMNKLYLAMGGAKGLNRMADKFGVDLSDYRHGVIGTLADGSPRYSREVRNAILMEELLAHVGEQGSPTLKRRVQELLGAIRAWLRKHGFVKLAKYGAADIAHLAKSAREYGLQNNGGRGGTRLMFGSALQLEFVETASALGGRKAYEKELSEGKTKLNYRQWVQVRTPSFKAWYGDWENEQKERNAGRDHRVSAKTDARTKSAVGRSWRTYHTGEPRVFFHGTRGDIRRFDIEHPDKKDRGWLGKGLYLSSEPEIAGHYAKVKKGRHGPNVMPLFSSVKNPYVAAPELKESLMFASDERLAQFTDELKSRGYDGVVIVYPHQGNPIELMVMEPSAVKSAIGNSGAFSAKSDDIRFSHSAMKSIEANIRRGKRVLAWVVTGKRTDGLQSNVRWHGRGI